MRPAAIAVACAALALAVGCGGDDETTTETTTEPAATGTTGAEPEQGESSVENQDGDSSGAGGAGPAGATPEDTLEEFFTSGDPDVVCGELATERALSSAYGDAKGCRQAQLPAAVPDSIEIVDIEEAGDEATATVIPEGGPNDGIETEVALVDEGGAWLVDSLEADVPAGP